MIGCLRRGCLRHIRIRIDAVEVEGAVFPDVHHAGGGHGSLVEEAHKAGYLLFQAHPYRPFIHRCDPDYIDGIEIWNGHTPKEANEKAGAWARETGKLIVSGGDCHSLTDNSHGGIITHAPIKNNADLLDVLRRQDFTPIPIYKPERA